MMKVWQVNVIPGQYQLFLTRVRGKSVYQDILDMVPLEQAPMYGLTGQIKVDHLERPNSLITTKIPWLADVELIMTAPERTKFLR